MCLGGLESEVPTRNGQSQKLNSGRCQVQSLAGSERIWMIGTERALLILEQCFKQLDAFGSVSRADRPASDVAASDERCGMINAQYALLIREQFLE
jgi:hypothetical protein